MFIYLFIVIYSYKLFQIIIIHVVYNDITNLHNSLELSHNPGKLGKILETTRTCSWGCKRATLPHLYLLPINQNHARIFSLDSGIGSISTINLSSTKFPAVNIIFGGFGLLSTIPDQDHPGDFWSRLQVQQLVQLILPELLPIDAVRWLWDGLRLFSFHFVTYIALQHPTTFQYVPMMSLST